MSWVNGEPSNQFDTFDRAIAYGDGCFTTIAKVSGNIQLLNHHIERLIKGCSILGIYFQDWEKLKQQIISVSASTQSTVIKVIISRGVGGRGYSPVGADQPNIILSLHDMPPHYDNWRKQGVRLGLSDIKLAKQDLWQGSKTLNRLEQVLAKQHARKLVDDELICDTDNMVIETSSANVFWKFENQWFTADLVDSGVVGVMRNHVLSVFAKNGMPVHIVRAHYTVLSYASEIFICNSLMNVIPVCEICFSSRQYQTINNASFGYINALINKSLNAYE
jgi:4-amino-4-deoxychorismate lyase